MNAVGAWTNFGCGRKKIFSSHIANLIATGTVQFLDVTVPIVFVVLIAQQYGMSELGKYSIATAVSAFATIFFGTGISNAVCFEIAAHQKNHSRQGKTLQAGFIIWLSTVCVVVPVTILFAWLITRDIEAVWLICAIMLGSILKTLTRLFNAVLRGRREIGEITWPALISTFLILVFVIPLLLNKVDLIFVCLTCSCCHLFLVLLSYKLIFNRKLIDWSKCSLSDCFALGFRSIPLTLEALVYRGNSILLVMLLPLWLTNYEIGIFNAGFKPFIVAVFPTDCLLQFSLPYIAGSKNLSAASFNQRIQLLHKASFWCSVVACGFIATFSESIAKFLSGNADTELEIARTMSVLAIAFAVYYLPPYAAICKALNNSKIALNCAFVQSLTMIISVCVLTPIYGQWGPVFSLVLAYTVYWLCEIRGFINLGLQPVAGITRYFLFLVGFGLSIYAIQLISNDIKAVGCFILSIICCSLVFFWNREDLNLMLRFLRSR